MGDPRLVFITTEDLLKEIMRRHDTVVLGIFDPQTVTSANFVLRAKGDLAWANLVVDGLKDFMHEMRAQSITANRMFTTRLDEPNDDEGEGP